MSASDGPVFVRNAQTSLENINIDSPQTGHREKDPEFVETLTGRFLDGEFGRSVACGVQLLDLEDQAPTY